MQVKLAGICFESLVNGEGLRRVYFAQGCRHNCPGCFNPETHSMDGGQLFDCDFLVEDYLKCGYLKGVTFSGGGPFEQPEAFGYLSEKFKEHGVNIWCYTGYTYEYLSNSNQFKKILNNIDVLVDGKFIKELPDNSRRFCGSKNQRIIKLSQN